MKIINHISECSKLAQKVYKTRRDWLSKVIHWELCKKLKFDHTNKWYMYNPEFVQKNETHKLLLNFEIQTDILFSARRYDLIIINRKKRTCTLDFAVPDDHRVKLKENENMGKYLDLAKELKKLWNMKVTVIPIVIGAFRTVTLTSKTTRRLGNNRTSGVNPHYSIAEIGQNTKKIRCEKLSRSKKNDDNNSNPTLRT